MKNYISYIPLTAFAASLVLGVPLSANEKSNDGIQIHARQNRLSDKENFPAMNASDLLGMNIDTHSDDTVGEIDEIFINVDTGEVIAIVVSTGGFLGMGQHQSLLSPEDLRFNGDRTFMQTDLSKNQVGNAPRYKKGETAGLDQVRPLGKRALDDDNRTERANQHSKNIQSNSRGMTISDLDGMSVENHQGEDIGDVDEIYINLDKREVVGVVVSTGGFLGLGDHTTLFGIHEISFDPTNEKVLLDFTRDQIREFPNFKTDKQSGLDNVNERMERHDPRDGTKSANRRDHSQSMKASKFLGMNIDNNDDDKIGEIDEIFIDSTTGKVVALVVSTGGFLELGQQQSLLSPEDLRFNGDRTLMRTDLTKDQIKTSPIYKKGETAGLDQVRSLGRATSGWDDRTDSKNRRDDEEGNSTITLTGKERSEHWNQSDDMQQNSRRILISDLMGMSVENHQGEDIGDVDEVYVDLTKSEVVGVVVSTGGFLGLGDQKNIFGMREVTIDPTNGKVLLDYTRDQIREFPAFNSDDDDVRDNLRQYMDRLDPRALDTTSGNAARARAHEMRGTSDKTEMDMRDNSENRSVSGNTARIHADEMNGMSDKTVFDQGNSSEEIDMTASIRTAIMGKDGLSGRADNVTIITSNGKVVLRGEVESASEKSTIENIAHKKAGRQNVNSQLTVRDR